MKITTYNWRLALLFGAAFLSAQLCWSQEQNVLICGSFLQNGNSKPIVTENAEIVDQFGNTYSRQSLIVPKEKFQNSQAESTNCGLNVFRLCLFGFTPAEEQTICSVFLELENYVGLCPGGSRPLIVVSKTAFGVGNNLPPTAGGVGKVYFLQECGVANPLTFQVMNSNVSWPEEAATAELYINSTKKWHTLSQDPNMATGSFDLYSVALHEALHILGFASRIGNNPQGTNPTSFSPWDTHITGGANNDPVLIADPTPQSGCCDKLMFNPVFGPIVGGYPSALFNNCNSNLQMGATGAMINNFSYSPGNFDANAVNNYFSHLDLCGPGINQYVMYAELLNETKRRNMLPAEMAILRLLGYCGPTFSPCNVIANDDLIVMTVGGPTQLFPLNNFIPFVNNDQHAGTYEISIDENCGTAFGASFASLIAIGPNQDIYLRIFPHSSSGPGTYTVCYTLTDCMGKCDDGVIYIQIVPDYDPLPPCPSVGCGQGQNLYCHGSFNDMLPITQSGQGQVGFPDCIPDNSVDVYFQTNTQDIRLYLHGPTETITVPLSSPVPPGCSLTVSFDAVAANQTATAMIDLLAGHDLPCESGVPENCQTPGEYVCLQNDIAIPGNSYISSSSFLCDDPIFGNEFPNCTGDWYLAITNNAVLAPYGPFTYQNNTTESWNYVMVSNKNIGSTGIYLDNLDITCSCPGNNCVCIRFLQSMSPTVCQGQILKIPVQICLEGQTGTSDVHVEAVIPDFPGLYIVPGTDFDGGIDLANMAAGTCENFLLQIYVGYTVPVDAILDISFISEATGASACGGRECVQTYSTTVVNCDEIITTECVNPPEWHLVCHEESNYFCITDAQGGSYYMHWIEPAFLNSTGHCQSLTGLTPGQTLRFVIHVYEEGIFLYDCEIVTQLDCNFFNNGGGRGSAEDKMDQLSKIQDDSRIKIAPNPSTGLFDLNLISDSEGMHLFELMDISGRVCRTWQRRVSEGPNKLEFSAGELTAGFYQLRWVSEEGAQLGLLKVLIQGGN